MRTNVFKMAMSTATVVWATAWGASAGAQTPQKSPTPQGAQETRRPMTQAELERAFEESLSGAVLTGNYTLSGAPSPRDAKEEKYTISKVSKLKGDLWLFHTRIQYADHDLTLPLPLEVKWAGDTPVITLTNVPVPGLGTFTARVVIYDGQYAGTWSGADHGGHLFGKVSKPAAADSAAEKKGAKPQDGKPGS